MNHPSSQPHLIVTADGRQYGAAWGDKAAATRKLNSLLHGYNVRGDQGVVQWGMDPNTFRVVPAANPK